MYFRPNASTGPMKYVETFSDHLHTLHYHSPVISSYLVEGIMGTQQSQELVEKVGVILKGFYSQQEITVKNAQESEHEFNSKDVNQGGSGHLNGETRPR